MAHVGLIVALDHYTNAKPDGVRYAGADALALAEALRSLDFNVAADAILIDAAATKTQIESRLRGITGRLTKDDALFVYYAGHGCSSGDGANYLMCHDTVCDDLEFTTISLDWIGQRLRASKCQQTAVFLDSCESGAFTAPSASDFRPNLDDSALTEFAKKAGDCVCFSACKSGENSYSAPELKQGIWAHHLVQALNGSASAGPTAKTGILTAAALQKTLAAEVPRSLRKYLTGKVTQSPWMSGSQNPAFQIADLSGVRAQSTGAAASENKQLKRASLLYTRCKPVAKLKGYVKGRHRVPDSISDYSKRLIAEMGSSELDEVLTSTFQRLKEAFKFKRRDCEAPSHGGGQGTILTPFFEFQVHLTQDSADPSQVIWKYEITNIHKPEEILSEGFESVFGNAFEIMELEFVERVSVADWIDRIEDLDDADLKLKYDTEATWCSISNADFEFTISSDTFRVRTLKAVSPAKLISAFGDAQRILVDKHGLKELPFATEPSA